MVKLERQSNIELLRIVLMLMIITHHILVHGFGLSNLANKGYVESGTLRMELFINSIVVVAVNSFVFISGYYGLKFRLRTIVSFVAQGLFYSVALYLLIFYKLTSGFSLVLLLQSFLPVSASTYWFLSVFLGLFFLSPFLNKGVEQIEKAQFKVLMFGILFFDCFSGFFFGTFSGQGYSLFHFITLYLVGRFISTSQITFRWPFFYFSLLTALLFASTMLVLHTDGLEVVWTAFGNTKYTIISKLFSYNNPLIILSCIMLFFIFKNLNFKNRAINILAASVFGVYLLHDHNLTRKLLSLLIASIRLEYSGATLLIYIAACVLGIFTAGIIIESLRKSLYDKIEPKLARYFEPKYRSLLKNREDEESTQKAG